MADKIRIGMIGCGGIAQYHTKRTLQIPKAEFVALCDISDESIARFTTAIPEVAALPVYKNYREMLDKVKMDAVMICTPHTLHFPMGMDSLDKGLHVLMEKPLVCSVDHAKKLIAKAEAMNRTILLSYQRHYQWQFRYMRRVIQEGQLGEITYLSALQCQQWKKGTVGKWRQDPALSGGGQLNDSGSHLIDAVLWTTGLAVEELTAYIDNLGTPVDINSALAFRFTNGAQGTVSVVGDAPCWYEDFTIWGEKGVLFYRNQTLTHCGPDGTMTQPEPEPEETNPDQNFVDIIRGRAQNQVPPVCGLRVIELTEAAWKSAELGTPVKVAGL